MLQCDNSGSGGAEAMRPVFVLGCAYRCGSTLLQRLLVSSGQLMLWGENQGLAQTLLEIVQRLGERSDLSRAERADFDRAGAEAWIANLNPPLPGAAIAACRAFLLAYYAEESARLGCPRWGFKEVRHGAAAARLLLDCFPRGRILFLVREPRALLASNAGSFWYAGADAVLAQWLGAVESMAGLDDPRVLTLRYEDLTDPAGGSLAGVEAHAGLAPGSIDAGLLARPLRGIAEAPRLGAEEERALADARVGEWARRLGYA